MQPVPDKVYHIDVLDFKGNHIICSEERWNDHIIADEPGRHPELEGCEELIVEALADPRLGVRHHDIDYPNRMSYYGRGYVTKYTRVVVEFKDSTCMGEGFIVTAIPVNNMKPQEKPELPC